MWIRKNLSVISTKGDLKQKTIDFSRDYEQHWCCFLFLVYHVCTELRYYRSLKVQLLFLYRATNYAIRRDVVSTQTAKI